MQPGEIIDVIWDGKIIKGTIIKVVDGIIYFK